MEARHEFSRVDFQSLLSACLGCLGVSYMAMAEMAPTHRSELNS